MTDGPHAALADPDLETGTEDEHLAIVQHIRQGLDDGGSTHLGDLALRAVFVPRFLG